MSKLNKNNPKIKIKKLDGSRPRKNMFKIPLDGFVIIDDPDYEFDDLEGAILE